MRTAVAAADFEAHEELRLLLWALLHKRLIAQRNRAELTESLIFMYQHHMERDHEGVFDYSDQPLDKAIDLAFTMIRFQVDHAGDPNS